MNRNNQFKYSSISGVLQCDIISALNLAMSQTIKTIIVPLKSYDIIYVNTGYRYLS